MTGLPPTLAAATRLMHNRYGTDLEGRKQREVDVQEVAGGYLLLDVRVGLLEAVADASEALRAGATGYGSVVMVKRDRYAALTAALAALAAAGATDQGDGET